MYYFEIEMSNNHDENTAMWICIKGTREPTVDEANVFCASDVKRYGMPVTGVFALSKTEAEAFYDLDNEKNWPVFGR